MNNTSLSGLLRGVQNRYDDCGISWDSHKARSENEVKTNFTKGIITAASAFVRAKQVFVELSKSLNDLDLKPRIDGPVVDQDEMDKRAEWLDIIARDYDRIVIG